MIFKGHTVFQNVGGKILLLVSDSDNRIWRYICFACTADEPPRPFQVRKSLSNERNNPHDCNEVVIAFHWDSKAPCNCISEADFQIGVAPSHFFITLDQKKYPLQCKFLKSCKVIWIFSPAPANSSIPMIILDSDWNFQIKFSLKNGSNLLKPLHIYEPVEDPMERCLYQYVMSWSSMYLALMVLL